MLNAELAAPVASRPIVNVAVERLLLDGLNPRLASAASDNQTPSQGDLLRLLWTEMSVNELVMSIAANGFFPEEPLFVVPEHPGTDPHDEVNLLVVVEGNRRLAAVKILTDPVLRDRLRVKDAPTLDATTVAQLQTLPVSIYRDRKELWTYLSFRHINAPMPWDAYSKAQFVAQVHDRYHVPLDEIIARVGDVHRTVARFMRGFRVLEQAQNESVFDPEDRTRGRFYFSHLYTALEYAEVRQFLGVEGIDLTQRNPVPTSHVKELRELLEWIYGRKSAGIEPVVHSQNPDLTNLRKVLGSPDALALLRGGYSLERSHQASVGDESRFRQALVRAREDLKLANGTVTTGYLGDPDSAQLVQTISDLVRALQREVKRIHDREVRRETRKDAS